jgi:predicted DNA-binding transcriptional regulator AlpA
MNDEPSYTIDSFCEAERISRSMFYKLGKQGKTPRTFRVGAAVHISPEARREWRREREAEAATA